MFNSDEEKLEYFHKNFPEIFRYFEQLGKDNKDLNNIVELIETRILKNIDIKGFLSFYFLKI